MRITKIMLFVLLFCSFCLTAFANISSKTLKEKAAAGEFKATIPRLMLTTSLARQNATANINTTIDKFRYQAEKIGNTNVNFEVVSNNADYVSLLFYGTAYLEGVAHPEIDTHALVINKVNGSIMNLQDFIKIPSVKFMKEQAALGKLKVLAIDGKTEIDVDHIQSLKTIPQEFIVDNYGNVYLLATDMTIYATGTPLILFPLDTYKDFYVAKG